MYNVSIVLGDEPKATFSGIERIRIGSTEFTSENMGDFYYDNSTPVLLYKGESVYYIAPDAISLLMIEKS